MTSIVAFEPRAAPLDQAYVPPPVAVKGIVVVVHVRMFVVGGVIAAGGAVRFCEIVSKADVVQPLTSVTVTVYVPGEVTVSAAEVPTTVVPFDQE